ncbi:hypothetical protein ACHAWO_011059 [Cyclotella atomus]|uniref:Uncharacterized protein n=1 Tax=Cyclotella atomus TaxID=382360 RepID=A0ABD3QDL4_9STRA
METTNHRRFPTLSSNTCSKVMCDSNRSSGREELFSPPTLPYTLEHVVENMNKSGSMSSGGSYSSNSQDTNIFVSPSSAASKSKNSPVGSSRVSPNKMGQFFCHGSYYDNAQNSNSVPLEDVLRWKEYRRRQKEQDENNLDLHIESQLNTVDSLSLSSASNSSFGDVHKKKDLEDTYQLQKSPCRSSKAVEIDQLGFPTSPTEYPTSNAAVENVENMTSISEAATEVASNTLFSRLMDSTNVKERMARAELGPIPETLLEDRDQTLDTPSSGIISSKRMDLRVNTTSPSTPSAATGPMSTKSISSAISTRSDTSARERFGDYKRSSSIENEWDDTKPTLDVDALNESSIIGSVESENKNDVSTISSNWDPLHVTTIEEGDESCRDDESIDLDRTNIHGSMDDSFVERSDAGRGVAHVNTSQMISVSPEKERPTSPCCTVPTLNEVKSFMSKLDSLREEQRMNHANRSKPTMSSTESPPKSSQSPPPPLRDSPTGVEIKEENTEDAYLKSLLEKKEKLRWHKLESQRKRNELDERLKAMRNKLQSPTANSTVKQDCESTNESLVVLGDASTNCATAEDDQTKRQFATSPTMLPGARWSGGRAIWSSPGSSQLSPEKDAKCSPDLAEEQPRSLPNVLSQDSDTKMRSQRGTGESSAASPRLKSPLHKVVKSMANIGAGLKRVASTDDQDCTAPQHTRSISLRQTASLDSVKIEDDYSLKPTMQIPFSPLVVSRKTASKFSFSSPDVDKLAASGSPPPQVTSPPNAPESSPAIPSTSPDVSEGDKGGGFGFLFGDKSVVSKSSSKFVELGQFDVSPNDEKEEETSLVGRTVKGSKEKKQRRLLDSSPCSSTEGKRNESPRVVAPDPPGVESSDVSTKESSRLSKKPTKRLSVDCRDDLAPIQVKDDNVDTTESASAKQAVLSIKPPPLSPVVESVSSDNDFESMIQKAKAISNTPRSSLLTPRSCTDTPRAANTAPSLKSPKFRADRDSKISALKSKFEAEGLVTPANSYSNNWANSSSKFGMESTKTWITPSFGVDAASRKAYYASSKPTTTFTEKPNAAIESYSIVVPTLSDVKEELTQTDSLDSSISSFKGLNIRELRSKFENNESISVGSNSKRSSFRVKDLTSKPSTSLESNVDDGGDSLLNTNNALRCAMNTNAHFSTHQHPEVAKTEEAGSGETENSSKENILDQTADGMFGHFSPVAVRKKAFETRKQQLRIRASTPKNDARSNTQNAVLVSQSSNVPASLPEVQAIAQSGTPRLSVKERVASFNSPAVYNQGMIQPKSSKQVVPFQMLTPPPGSIQMSYTNQTPSPLWTNSQQDGTLFSPMASFGSPQARPQQRQPTPNQPIANSYGKSGISHQRPQNYSLKAVDTSYDDDDYEDGITLSPTCSEVSGLTLPTCLGSVAEDKPKTRPNASNIQECMSPIARHRQKQGANSNGNLFNHPYLKRMMSNVSTPRASGHQQQLNNPQEKRPSHREQIISRVIEKPPSPRKSKAAPSRKPPPPQNRKSINKSASNQSTITTVSSDAKELQSPQRKKQPQRPIPNQSSLTTSSSTITESQSQSTTPMKGKVAQRVAMVEKSSRQSTNGNHLDTSKIALRGAKEAKKRYTKQAGDEQSSAATRDCLRLN